MAYVQPYAPAVVATEVIQQAPVTEVVDAPVVGRAKVLSGGIQNVDVIEPIAAVPEPIVTTVAGDGVQYIASPGMASFGGTSVIYGSPGVTYGAPYGGVTYVTNQAPQMAPGYTYAIGGQGAYTYGQPLQSVQSVYMPQGVGQFGSGPFSFSATTTDKALPGADIVTAPAEVAPKAVVAKKRLGCC